MAENPRIEELRRRVLADPASIAFAALAEEFRRVGRNEDAIETCRTGLQRHPAYLSARVTLGRALIETGDYDGAREELETVLRSAPENLAAIRGLATIHERLGHSSEMDPHLADIMKTHAESIPVQPPPPDPVVFPEPSLSPVEPEPRFDPFQQFQMEPRPEQEPVEPVDVFRSVEAFQPQPVFQPEPESVPHSEPDPDPVFEPAPVEPEAQSRAPEFDLSLAPPLGVSPTPDPDLAMVLEPETELEPEAEPEPEPEIVAASGPDPEMLATLARLERFLDSIQSLRA
jgi:hypothetical protein